MSGRSLDLACGDHDQSTVRSSGRASTEYERGVAVTATYCSTYYPGTWILVVLIYVLAFGISFVSCDMLTLDGALLLRRLWRLGPLPLPAACSLGVD